MNIELLADSLHSTPQKISLQPLAGDASLRRYYRANLSQNSVIIAHYPPLRFEEQAEIFESTHALLREADIRVPQILSRIDELHCFVLEDLGDTLLSDLFAKKDPSLPKRYREAVALLEQLQALTQDPLLCQRYPLIFTRALDTQKLRSELDYFVTHTVKGFLKMELATEQELSLTQALDQLISKISALPKTLAHRDFHSRNLMFKGDQLVLIDFQDLQPGPHLYDLASLLYDPYVPIDEPFRKQLQVLSGIDSHTLAVVAIQRLLKACGTYSAQWLLRDKAYYLPYIQPALQRAQTLASSCDDLDSLRTWIRHWQNALA